MKTGNDKSIGAKLGSLTSLIKDTKYLIFTILTLVVLGMAVLSGDGKNIALSFYENVTGNEFETFSPVQDFSNETYLILKDTLSRNSSIRFENADIFIFEESDTSHKYRVEFKDETYFYIVKKKSDGLWKINREK